MSVVAPPEHVLQQVFPVILVFLRLLVDALVATPGFTVLRASSWWRDAETNRRVSGQPDSQHLLGLAVDIVGPRQVLEDFLIAARGIDLVALDEGTHVHVQLLRAGVARAEGFFA